MALPFNRLIVGGVDLSERFNLILADGYTLSPPKPKTYVIDIPGGNGKLDLTETLLGDIAYDNRSQSFKFYVIAPESFEAVKTAVSNFLHGKMFDYQMTMDPGYTYHGRFTVKSYSHSSYANGIVGTIEVDVDADPYKTKANEYVEVDATGGIIIRLRSGRLSVRPTIELNTSTKIIYNNKMVRLPMGSWNLTDLVLKEGVNEIYLNSYDIRIPTWGDFKERPVTWGQLGTKHLFEWYNYDGTLYPATWKIYQNSTWEDESTKTWFDFSYIPRTPSDIEENVFIEYEWRDL